MRTPKILLSFLFLLPVIVAASCDAGPGMDPAPTPPQERFIVVGQAGTILLSDDSGATFSAVTSGTTETLRGVAADSLGHCAAVGTGGTFLYSGDHGDTWHAGTCATINVINRVISYGTNKFIAVGEASGPDPYGIFRSTDGGKNWDRYATTVTLKGIGGRSSTDFVAVGTAGEALYSPPPADVQDTGKNWQQGSSGVTVELYGVCHVEQ